MGDPRIRLHERDEDRSKFGARACELNRKGWEDEAEVPPVPEVSRTEDEPPSRPSANTLSAIVCAIVLFPVPANPFNQ